MKKPNTQTTDSRSPRWIHRTVEAQARPLAWLAVLLAALIALPTAELAAQDCIDFEIDPVTGVAWVPEYTGMFNNEVSTQYEATHGISFSVVSGPGVPTGGACPRICKVGAPVEAFSSASTFESCDGSDVIDGIDNPDYSTIPNPPTPNYPPTVNEDDVKCFFLSDHTADGAPNDGDNFVLRVTYSDWRECYQLSGRIIDIDVHGIVEEWTITAYGDHDNDLNTAPVALPGPQTLEPMNIGTSPANGDGDGTIQSFTIDVSAGGIPIDYVDIAYTGDISTNTSVGLGFDNFCPCSIDEGGCGQIIEPDIECDLDTPGNYNYSFHIGNDSDFDVVKVLIPDVILDDGTLINVEPNIIETFIYDQDASGLIDLTFSGGAPGTSFDLAIGLMAKNDDGELFECCQLVETIELPHCCNELVVADLVSGENDDGDLVTLLQFDVENSIDMQPSTANHLFLVPIDPPWLTFEPDYFYLGSAGIGDNSQTGPLSTQLGLDPRPGSGSITFEVVIHNEDFSECCNEIHTLGLDGEPLPAEAPFIRGDGNADGLFDIGDAVYLLDYLFVSTGPVPCEAAADTNCDALIDLADSIYTLEALFAGGSDPPYPYPGCGLETETNPDHLECQSYGVCP